MPVADSNKTFRDPGPAETVCPVETARRLRAEAQKLRERSARLRMQFDHGREIPQGHPQHPEPK